MSTTEQEMTLEQKLTKAFEHAMIKIVSDGGFIQPKYENRLVIEPAMLRAAWNAVDRDAVIKQLASRATDRVADTIFNAMATEIATDVKQIMSNKELREDVRALIRDRMRATMASVSEPT